MIGEKNAERSFDPCKRASDDGCTGGSGTYRDHCSHYLRYEELLDETAEPTINYIKVSGKGLEVSKKGLVNVHMVFEQGKKNMTYYTTPYGTLQMGISATNLELTESEENLQIKADYALDMNEEHVADCYLAIQVQPRDCKDFVL